MATITRSWLDSEVFALKLVILAIAGAFVYVGYWLLTSPLWVPVTIGIWLGAAMLAGPALTLHVPDLHAHTTAETPAGHWSDRWVA
jgi:drug/metabolite transporter (DMT)-like permease